MIQFCETRGEQNMTALSNGVCSLHISFIIISITCNFWCNGEVCGTGELYFNCTKEQGIFIIDSNLTKADTIRLQNWTTASNSSSPLSIDTYGCVWPHCTLKSKKIKSFKGLDHDDDQGCFWLHHVRGENETPVNLKCSVNIKSETINNATMKVWVFFLAPYAKYNNTCLTFETLKNNVSFCTGSNVTTHTQMLEGHSMNISFQDGGTKHLDFQVLIHVYGTEFLPSHLECSNQTDTHTVSYKESMTSKIPVTTREATSSTSAKEKPESKPNGFIIPVAATLGCVPLIALLVVVILIIKRRTNRQTSDQPNPVTDDDDDYGMTIVENDVYGEVEKQTVYENTDDCIHPSKGYAKHTVDHENGCVLYENHQLPLQRMP